MWVNGWREQVWHDLDRDFDIIVIGGGITGAGIFHLAAARGLKVLLVEQGDFASGTSSRSSKLIHGGFRYLRNGQINVTRESVREREWLLHEAPHLVTPLGFIMPCPADRSIAFQFRIGVILYDLLAPKWNHRSLNREEMLDLCPALAKDDLAQGCFYYDARMDDARMVLRLIAESLSETAHALNYTRATSLLRDTSGKVCGVVIRDLSAKNLGDKEVRARVVINATGPWSDEVRQQLDAPARLRKLRGSHLVFSSDRLNLPHAVTLLHPCDHRAMFAIPWEGVTLVGTTDLDHSNALDQGEPFCTDTEVAYILEAAQATFPTLDLQLSDVLSSFSGLRPVVNTGAVNPSKESRAHVVWEEEGLITITGGKYTTFRIMAETTLSHAFKYLTVKPMLARHQRYFKPLPKFETDSSVSKDAALYLSGKYGAESSDLLSSARKGENQRIHTLPNLWSEIRWAARSGAVEHLDDLLLRRVRLGLQLPDGASAELGRIRGIAQNELGWSDARWEEEENRYLRIYHQFYAPVPQANPVHEEAK
jgi:glycerol-3-phosphate dehydrogenase